jgi:hypothetical protein
MARRESQGLQITLIVFVMLTIILAVTTIAFWNRSKGLTEQNNSLQTSNAELQSSADKALDEATQMKVWLGHSADTSVEEIKQQYERDMNTYARSAAEAQRTYKDVPAVLFAALQQRNSLVADLRQQLKQAQDEFEQTRQQLQAALDESKRIQAESEAELRKTRDDFAAARETTNREKDQLAAELQKVRGQYDELQAANAKQIEALQRDLKNQEIVISQRNNQLKEVTAETFDVPDGKILWVNPRTGVAYVNLGSADGLRRQVTFSIFGVDVNNLARAEKKGTLEITRVVNEHLAEGRISDDTLEDPVLQGDLVYTPLWNAKSALHFALAGFMDIDGDSKDDRELVKQLIQVNNGTIDAEDKGGEVVGEVTSHTRYLIRGDEPSLGEEGDVDATAQQKAWSDLIDQADRLGVEQLTLEKLLDLVGYDGERRTIPLGEAARPDDFVPRPGAQPGQGSVFREREPRSRRQGGN